MNEAALSTQPTLRWRAFGASGRFGAVVGGALLGAALVGARFAAHAPSQLDLLHELERPSSQHWLGTGENGIDILSHLLAGARISLSVGLLTVGVSAAIGTLLGAVAGLAGGWIEAVMMRFVDVLLAFPGILLAIFIAAVLPPSRANVVVALAATGWVGYARLVRAEVTLLRRSDFVVAARALGSGGTRILTRHLLPNAVGAVLVQATFGLPAAILAEASLSFLGLGMPPGTPSWGALVDQGAHYLLVAPHVAVFSGAVLAISVLGLNLLGDALRDRLDPRGG